MVTNPLYTLHCALCYHRDSFIQVEQWAKQVSQICVELNVFTLNYTRSSHRYLKRFIIGKSLSRKSAKQFQAFDTLTFSFNSVLRDDPLCRRARRVHRHFLCDLSITINKRQGKKSYFFLNEVTERTELRKCLAIENFEKLEAHVVKHAFGSCLILFRALIYSVTPCVWWGDKNKRCLETKQRVRLRIDRFSSSVSP